MADNMAAKAGVVSIGDLKVNRIGLGTNRIADNEESSNLLKRAVELGVNFFDTAHRYGAGVSELTIGKTISGLDKDLVIATKGGFDYGGESGSPEALRKDLEESLTRLNVDHIDLYQLHRVDPKVPIEVSVGALKDFQKEGKIRYIGLSEVDQAQLQEAQKVAKIVSVQNIYNIFERKHEDLVDYCTASGIVFIPWFPLGGLDGGAEKTDKMLASMASLYHVTTQQLAIAWLLMRSPLMLPIPGTLSINHLEANLRSAEILLNKDDYDHLMKIK